MDSKSTPRVDALLASWPSTLDTPGDAEKMRALVVLARELERQSGPTGLPAHPVIGECEECGHKILTPLKHLPNTMKDAERYRWLRNSNDRDWNRLLQDGGEPMDAIIDQEMQRQSATDRSQG